MSYLPIKDLAVLQFKIQSKNELQPVFNWRKDNKIPYAESCFRQIWYGPNDRFQSFPMNSLKEYSPLYLTGYKAYEHMMRLSLGLMSKRPLETNIAGQLDEGWKELQEFFPQETEQYIQLMQYFKADTKLIRGRLMPHYKHKRHELCARDLSQMQNKDKVLIIGHLTEDNQGQDRISQFTDGICRVLTSRKNNSPSEIHITHPEQDTAKMLYDQLNHLSKAGKVKARVFQFDFSNISKAVEQYDRIFITLPMSKNHEADMDIILAWQNRVRQNNTLTHLIGCPRNNGNTVDFWRELSDDFISPYEIRQEMTSRTRSNEDVLRLVDEAIEFCIDARSQGRQPSFYDLKKSVPEIALF